MTSESQSGLTQSLPLRREEWLGVMSSSQDPKSGLVLSGHLSFVHFTDGLWSRWRLGSTCLCKSSLWSSADGQEVNRILCFPQWALCLNSQLFPQELSGLCIYFQSFLPCVPYFAQPRRLKSGCWRQRYCGLRATTKDHTARERRRGP